MLTKEATGTVKAFNHMRLDENSAIGYHQHIDDLEIYIITEGAKPLMLTKEATSCGLKCFYMSIYTSIKKI